MGIDPRDERAVVNIGGGGGCEGGDGHVASSREREGRYRSRALLTPGGINNNKNNNTNNNNNNNNSQQQQQQSTSSDNNNDCDNNSQQHRQKQQRRIDNSNHPRATATATSCDAARPILERVLEKQLRNDDDHVLPHNIQLPTRECGGMYVWNIVFFHGL
jgi:hypothetical protein